MGGVARCARCNKRVRGHIKRDYCRHVYCGRRCFGLARRVPKRERVAAKAKYDREYRAKNAARLKAEKAAYYQRTRDPEKERKIRKANMARHVAYCRKPAYRAKKVEYDKRRRADQFGLFGEAWLVLLGLEREIRKQLPDKYERMKARGYFTRTAQQRRRELWLRITKN